MLNRLIFVLGWSKKNKGMMVVFLLVLSLIIASNLLLVQFFVEESTFDERDRHYYTYYLEDTVTLDDIKSLMKKLENKVDVCECVIAANPNQVSPYNDYFVAAYLKRSEQDEEERNNALSYGEWNEKENEYIADMIELPSFSFFEKFQCAGVGSTQVGSKYADYRITMSDFETLSLGVDVIDVILFSKDRESVDAIINDLGVAYKAEYQDLFLQSGFDSIKNSVILSIIILVISLYSIIAFVEIFLRMQEKDIRVFYRCGATLRDLKITYILEMMVAGLASYVLGVMIANIMCRLLELRYDAIAYAAYTITFFAFFIVYVVEICIYIGVTLKDMNILCVEEDC